MSEPAHLDASSSLAPAEKPRRKHRRTLHPTWFPSAYSGENFRLAPSLAQMLRASLGKARNREDTFKLAVWLARMNAGPKRFGKCFPICRQALTKLESLGLTENRIRGAIKKLLEVGFIRLASESEAKARLGDAGWKCDPNQYLFDGEYEKTFRFLLRKAKSPERRDNISIKDSTTSRVAARSGEKAPSRANSGASKPTSAASERSMETAPRPSKPFVPVVGTEDPLEMALARLHRARMARMGTPAPEGAGA